ncbi:hypothetical protein K6119_05170 [Paracrocinitomix mangrovi]|uniref:hypothetical protein n=1 Tax=Paracrocinitomix mangrovi TaxID=2862509 RepID=UPI001C8F07B0|nr:hypothetical protein [Paracrocinitomix mangrovi]UKN02904.1 hypothetical protein K6119_05170 [Paracrocinitomix mangrovi]
MYPSTFLRTFSIIYFALAMGMIAFGVISFISTQNVGFFMVPTFKDPFIIVVPAVLVLGISGGNVLYKKMVAAVTPDKSLQQRISIFFTSSIIKFAMTEATVLVSFIAVVMTLNSFYYIIGAIGLVYYFTIKPSKQKIADILQLTSEEKDKVGIQ